MFGENSVVEASSAIIEKTLKAVKKLVIKLKVSQVKKKNLKKLRLIEREIFLNNL